jgi:molybdenum cofactor guanylyltransferase
MGASKALLNYGGTPLWLFQIEKLIRLNPEQLFFSVQAGSSFPPGAWTFVYDRSAELGPLGGLDAALHLTCQEFLVTLAVDMPAMTSAFLSSLLKKAGPAGVVPHLNGFYHGAAAVYPTSILPIVERLLDGDDRSFQHLTDEALKVGLMTVEEITSAQSALFENWNAPDDLSRAGSRSFSG